MSKILVTGGLGAIGFKLVNELKTPKTMKSGLPISPGLKETDIIVVTSVSTANSTESSTNTISTISTI